MARREFTEASVRRALEHHRARGVVRSFRPPDLAHPRTWVIDLRGIGPREYLRSQAHAVCVALRASESTLPCNADFVRIEDVGVNVTITRSAGRDRAALVMIDTNFEPDGSDGGSGLRVLVNDEPAYVGKQYEPSPDIEDR